MQRFSIAALLSATLLASAQVSARLDLARGEKLHNAHCTACHGSMTGGDGTALYTRSPRLVNSMQELTARVRRCASGLDLMWFGKDIADVVHYLNEGYYRFGE